jgi:tripartite-type tricarboxylate transporter receptor subunit TctC
MRTASGILLAAAIVASATTWAAEPGYPSKPIRIIVAQTAGGISDLLARTFAQKFSEAWKQPAVVENRAGAGGAIGTEVAAKAPADGYTLLLSSAGPIVINQSLYRKLGYDPIKDLLPITFIATSPLVLVTHPSVPAKSVKELIALAKARAGSLTYGSGGSGSPPHLTAELFKAATHTDIIHVPFKGSGPSVIAVVAGQIDLSFSTVVLTLPQINASRLRALAVTSPKHSKVLPNLPTMIEAGVPGFESQQWFALFGQTGLPKDIVAKVNGEAMRIMQSPEFRERIANDGGEPGALSQEQFAAFIRVDAARWAKVVKESGAKAE